jgi:hypothetical protein
MWYRRLHRVLIEWTKSELSLYGTSKTLWNRMPEGLESDEKAIIISATRNGLWAWQVDVVGLGLWPVSASVVSVILFMLPHSSSKKQALKYVIMHRYLYNDYRLKNKWLRKRKPGYTSVLIEAWKVLSPFPALQARQCLHLTRNILNLNKIIF